MSIGPFDKYDTTKEEYKLFKTILNGHARVYIPKRDVQYNAFDAFHPNQIRNDKIYYANEYFTDPITAESVSLPHYQQYLQKIINIKGDIWDKFCIIYYFNSSERY